MRPLFGSRAGKMFAHALLFSVPGAFFALGLVMLALDAKAKDGVGALFLFGFLTLLVSAYCGIIPIVPSHLSTN